MRQKVAGVTGLEPATSGVTGHPNNYVFQSVLQKNIAEKPAKITKSCNTGFKLRAADCPQKLTDLSTPQNHSGLESAAMALAGDGIDCGNVSLPPKEYDFMPKRHVPIRDNIDQKMLNLMVSGGRPLPGPVCGFYSEQTDTILLSPMLKNQPDQRARVLRHEFGHANGWRH